MKTRFKYHLMIQGFLLLGTILSLNSCSKESHTVDAGDYGLKEDKDAVLAINKALEACVEQKARKLVIPKGEYHFYPEKATEKYVRVSNNDNSLKRILFPVNGMKHFEIDGQGSEFIMHGHMLPFDIEYSEDITLKNFSINWSKPFYFQGEVVAANTSNNSFDLKVYEECDYEIVAGELLFLEKANSAIRPWRDWAFPVEEAYGWEQNIDWNIWFDPQTKAPAYNHERHILRSYNENLQKRYHAEEIEKGLVRFFDANANLPEIGWVLIIKGRKDKNRLSPAIHLFHNKNILLENIDVYHAGGMGLIAERTENVKLKRFNVVLPPSSGRMVTTTADATHFVNCKGEISIDSCHFENMLDDASNFHGIYTKVDHLLDDYTIGVRIMHGQQTGFQFAETGDSVRLSDSKTMKAYAVLKVSDVNYINEEYLTLTSDQKIGEILKPGSVVDNISWQPDVVVRNSSVKRNRARSILISTQGDVLIENNDFSSCTHISMLFEGDATFWYESGPVTNVVIRNNKFKDFGLGAGYGPLIQFSPRVSIDGDPGHYYHKNVYFENNTCEVFTNLLVKGESVQNFVFRGNTITQSNDYPFLVLDTDVFTFKDSKDIIIENNNYLLKDKANIVSDRCMNVYAKGNNGIIDN